MSTHFTPPRSRAARLWFVATTATLCAVAVVAADVVIEITGPDGKTTRVVAPAGSEVKVGKDGNVQVVVPEAKTGDPAQGPRGTPNGVVVQRDPAGSEHELARVTLPGGKAATAAAICPQGKLAAVGWEDGTTTVLDVATRKTLHHFDLYPTKQSGPVADLAFARDEANGHTLLAIGCGTGLLQVWNAGTGKPVYAIDHPKGIKRVAFSTNGRWVATTDNLGWVHVRDAQNLNRVGQGEGGEPHLVAWAGSKLLVLRERDHVPQEWDLLGGTANRQFRSTGVAATGAKVFLPGDNRILVGESRDGQAARLRLVELEVAKEPLGTKPGPAREVWGVDLTAGIDRVAAGGGVAAAALRPDGAVAAFDLKDGREVRRFAGHTERVSGLAVSPDGRLLLSASSDRTARLWALPDRPDPKPGK